MQSVYYQGLSTGEKQAYRAVVAAFAGWKHSVSIPAKMNVEALLRDITASYPEYFHIEPSYSYTESLFQTRFTFAYRYKPAQYRALLRQIHAVQQSIVAACINENQSDYDKVLHLHDYLKTNLQYDDAAANATPAQENHYQDAHNLVGALLHKKCVCDGFSYAMKSLCALAGVECHVVFGEAKNSVVDSQHAWNLVYINGYYYHLDVTWDNQFAQEAQIPNYAYLNLDDKTISQDHIWDKALYPPCPQDDCSYFEMNNACIASRARLETFFYENFLSEIPYLLFKVAKNSALSLETERAIRACIFSAAKRCKYVMVIDYAYQCIPEQQVYMIQPIYRMRRSLI